MKPIVLFFLGLFTCLAVQAQTIYYVKQNGSGAKTGLTWDDAMANVQSAITAASAGDQVWVAAGKFYGSPATNFGIVLKNGVALYGGLAGTESAISDRVPGHISQLMGDYVSGNNNNAAVSASAITQATVLDGFTISPSQSVGPLCRGIYLNNVSADLKINNCIIDGNTTKTVYGNGYGAGIYMENGSSPVITNCTISNNTTTDYGGGVYNLNSSPVFVGCSFLNNTASRGGGGAFNEACQATYSHCIFQGNQLNSLSSNFGGAVTFESGDLSTLNNCLLTGNTAGTGGAAIKCTEAGLSIISCTITGNIAGNQIGGGAIYYSETGANTMSITNSIIWNNISSHGDGSLQLNEIIAQNGSSDPGGSNNLIKYGQYGSLVNDPMFEDAASGNFQLQPSSSAVNAGNNTAGGYAAGDTDLLGHQRISDGVVDLGAFETLTDQITNNGLSSFNGFNGALDITGNPYDNGLADTYKWKMIISSTDVNEVLVVDPNDLSAYKATMDAMGITFDSTHFQVGDLTVMPSLLQLITGTPGWDKFNGDILISRVVYPNQVQADSVLSNGELITISSALPVSVKDFTGELNQGTARLEWHTGMESAFDHFELEKSLDGKAFVHLSNVTAMGDNSTYKRSIAQAEQEAYYRLKLINKDGSNKYYDQLLILTQDAQTQIRIYPNPATTAIHVEVAHSGILQLFDPAGRCVQSVTLNQGLNEINISQLSKGIYFGLIDGSNRFKVIKK